MTRQERREAGAVEWGLRNAHNLTVLLSLPPQGIPEHFTNVICGHTKLSTELTSETHSPLDGTATVVHGRKMFSKWHHQGVFEASRMQSFELEFGPVTRGNTFTLAGLTI